LTDDDEGEAGAWANADRDSSNIAGAKTVHRTSARRKSIEQF
jgi:hypothetical protein